MSPCHEDRGNGGGKKEKMEGKGQSGREREGDTVPHNHLSLRYDAAAMAMLFQNLGSV
jgi:hypothetical protein